MAERCCDRHHYSCHLGEDGPPIPCCPGCPARPYPDSPLFG